MSQRPPAAGGHMSGPALRVSIEALVWAAAVAVFLALRLGPVWRAPVSGAELIHLSGAWQARIGVEDGRFVPSLFQAISALTLHATTSEVPARILAWAASATIPLAFWLLRPVFGRAGALLALAVLAVDPPGILLDASASALGFDAAVAAWLFVAAARWRGLDWVWLPAGFLVATSGPAPLVFAAAAMAVALARAEYPRPAAFVAGAVGAALGVAAASAGFGFGHGAVVVPPFALFAAGYDQEWSTLTASQVVALYDLPLMAAGAAALAWTATRVVREGRASRDHLILLAWAGLSLAWLVSSSRSHSPVPVASAALPFALLIGPLLAAASGPVVRADWRLARFLLPVAATCALLALAVVVDWARMGATGDGADWRRVLALAAAAVACLGALAIDRRRAPTLAAAGLVAGVLGLLPGVANIAVTAPNEPLASPASPSEARIARRLVLELASTSGGLVAVHERFADSLTWPFRDSGDLVLSSAAPPAAAALVWPADLPAPEGFARLEGDLAMVEGVAPPTSGFLAYVGWLVDRNILATTGDRAVVYTRDKE